MVSHLQAGARFNWEWLHRKVQELGRKRLGIAAFEVLFLDRDQLLYRFVLEMDLQRLLGREWGAGTGGTVWEGLGGAVTLLLATGEMSVPSCRLCAEEQPKSHLNRDSKH